MVELAPDGVASVRISYATGMPIVVPTSENAYAFSPPSAAARRLERYIREASSRSPGRVRHMSKKRRRRLEEGFARQLRRLLDAIEPTKVEWLDGAGVVVHAATRPKEGSLGGILG